MNFMFATSKSVWPHYFFTRFDLAASNFIVLEAKIIVTIEYVSGKSALPKNSH